MMYAFPGTEVLFRKNIISCNQSNFICIIQLVFVHTDELYSIITLTHRLEAETLQTRIIQQAKRPKGRDVRELIER